VVENKARLNLGVVAGLAAVLFLLGSLGTVARAGDMVPAGDMPGGINQSGALDGNTFVGQFGADGKDAKGTDVWIFENGMFASENCIDCGFPKNPYWVRTEDGKTAFRTESICPKTEATIVWEGTVKDGQIEGYYTWSKERWYWTVEKKYWFKGTLKQSAAASATDN